jgi:hypothetical protein
MGASGTRARRRCSACASRREAGGWAALRGSENVQKTRYATDAVLEYADFDGSLMDLFEVYQVKYSTRTFN